MEANGTRTPVGIEETHGLRLFSAPLGSIDAELFLIEGDVTISRANGYDAAEAIRNLEASTGENLMAVTLYVNGEPHSIAGAFVAPAEETTKETCSCWIETGDLSEWPVGSGRLTPKLVPCQNEATRYMRVGREVIEHVCESCYQRDIVRPGASPATEHDYDVYQDSFDDD